MIEVTLLFSFVSFFFQQNYFTRNLENYETSLFTVIKQRERKNALEYCCYGCYSTSIPAFYQRSTSLHLYMHECVCIYIYQWSTCNRVDDTGWEIVDQLIAASKHAKTTAKLLLQSSNVLQWSSIGLHHEVSNDYRV